jgi:hypothetical protein
MKICCRCKNSLETSHFKKNSARKDGLQSQCVNCQKEYRAEHYQFNRHKYIRMAQEVRRHFSEWWCRYKKQFKCVRCSEDHPACIQFHHPDDNKDLSVSRLIALGSKKRALVEIAKCIPLCANCHAKEHYVPR